MMLEYLFSDDTYKVCIDNYQSDFCEKKIITISGSQHWIVTFEKAGENENTAMVLSTIHEDILANSKPIVLSNGAAEYYNKVLYPYFNQFERKLRKLLRLKSALCPGPISKKIINRLEDMSIGDLFITLFGNVSFREKVKSLMDTINFNFSKEELIQHINALDYSTFWDEYIGVGVVPALVNNITYIRKYRNDTMHAHEINTEVYNYCICTIRCINQQIDDEIRRLVGSNDQTNKTGKSNFNTALSNIINIVESDSLKSFREFVGQLKYASSNSGVRSLINYMMDINNDENLPIYIDDSKPSSNPQFASDNETMQEGKELDEDGENIAGRSNQGDI